MTAYTSQQKLLMFRAGQYKFQPPPVPHGQWDDTDWVVFIDRCGTWVPTLQPAHRLIMEIARDIKKAWPKPYFGAVPYINAMACMTTADKLYGEERCRDVLNYFLANANTFRGEEARKLKQELKDLIAAR